MGGDSRFLDILYRLSPRYATNFIQKKMSSLLEALMVSIQLHSLSSKSAYGNAHMSALMRLVAIEMSFKGPMSFFVVPFFAKFGKLFWLIDRCLY